MRPLRALPVLASLLAVATVAHAADEGPGDGVRFAVVDVSSNPAPAALVSTIEREVARLRPGWHPLDDQPMRRLLGNGEGPAEAAARLVGEARKRFADGDCAAAEARATEAEAIALPNLAVEDERVLLTDVNAIRARCADARGDAAAVAAAALRLRALTPTPPPEFPADLWDARIAGAVAPPGTVELFVDSEPPNAQVFINARSEGVTPRTLKVPPGEYDVEVQKDGFRKGYRHVKVRDGAPARAVFRLVDRTRDRQDQVAAELRSLRKEGAIVQPSTLARIAQLARVDQLVVVTAEGTRVGIGFFDADRGGVLPDRVDSRFDPVTGKVDALAARPTPSPGSAGARASIGSPGILAPIGPGGAATRAGTAPEAPSAATALPEAGTTDRVPTSPRRQAGKSPWWGWLIAGAILTALGVAVYLDQPHQSSSLDVRAHWDGVAKPPGR
jgi:hypothetical protein